MNCLALKSRHSFILFLYDKLARFLCHITILSILNINDDFIHTLTFKVTLVINTFRNILLIFCFNFIFMANVIFGID